MIYATTPEEIAVRRKAFLREWWLKCKAVADSLEEAGERLFTFTRLPPSQWRSLTTSNQLFSRCRGGADIAAAPV